jgi:hypothetical protein
MVWTSGAATVIPTIAATVLSLPFGVTVLGTFDGRCAERTAIISIERHPTIPSSATSRRIVTVDDSENRSSHRPPTDHQHPLANRVETMTGRYGASGDDRSRRIITPHASATSRQIVTADDPATDRQTVVMTVGYHWG